jgi:dTDP-4-amino-4,6-dideoxygalactose transaminase
MQELVFQNRLSEIQCSLGCPQIQKLDSFMNSRFELTSIHDSMFSFEDKIRSTQTESKEVESTLTLSVFDLTY